MINLASQSLEADFLLPLRFKCNKLILVGDPNQLAPCVLSDAGNNYGLYKSLYARLYSVFEQYTDGPISMLDTQYRMHPDICQFSSDYFYSSRLSTDDSVARRMINFTLKPLYLYNITNSPHSYDAASSSLNEGEAGLIRDFCQRLIVYLVQQPVVTSDNSDDDDDDGEEGDNDDDESTITSSSRFNSRY